MIPLPFFLRTLRCLSAVLAATVVLGACDSSSRIENYVPTRIVSFGDEISLLEASGGKHTINSFASGSTTTLDCDVGRIWNQNLAASFGLAFSQCKPASIAVANGAMLAVRGAKMDAIEAQVATLSASDLVPATLVTIQGGLWDIIDAYNTYKAATNRDAAFTQVAEKGAQLAVLINRLTNNGAGARVIYATVPDLGYTPLALADQTAGACQIDCRVFLTDLTRWFNTVLRVGTVDGVRFGDGVVNDGRYAALVASDDILRAMANPAFRSATYGLTNTDAATQTAACVPSGLTDNISLCNPGSLVAGAAGGAFTYLWASDVLPGPAWHLQVGNTAIIRARNNPF